MRVLLLALLVSIPSFGSRFNKPIGNAEVLVCSAHGNIPESSELIDTYESSVLRKVYPNFEGAGDDVLHRLALMRDRFPAFDSLRRDMFWNAVSKDFFYPSEKTLWLENAQWPDAPVAEEMPLPEGCRLKVMAYINAPENRKEPTYIIDNDRFYKMSPEGQAAVLAHLVLLRDALLNYGHKDQLKTRLLVGDLSAGALIKDDPDEANRIFDYADLLQETYGLDHSPIQVHAAPVKGKQTVFFAEVGGSMELYLGGNVATARVGGPRGSVAYEDPKIYLCDPRLSEYANPQIGSQLTFHENGCPYSVTLGSSLEATLFGGKKAVFYWEVSFSPQGKLEWAIPCLEKNEYYNTKGELKNYPSGFKLHFDEQGRVIDI